LKRPLPLAAALLALAGCAEARVPEPITGVVIPVRDTVPSARQAPREAPPPSGPAKPYRFPKAVWAELPTGLRVGTAVSKALPVVQIRVVVTAGSAADGEKTGIAALTAQLLKEGGAGSLSGRDLATRLAALGAELSVDVGPDSTTLGLAVTRDHLDEALALLGAVVQRPQLSAAEFGKLKKRQVSALVDAARARGDWGAQVMLHRDLFAMPSEHHPYASWSPTPAELSRLTVADCQAFHRRFYGPRSTFVVVAGDTTPEAARDAVSKAFKAAAGAEAPVISFADPMPHEGLKITLVDRPGSARSDVYVGLLGPERGDKGWAAFAVASQILGGGVTGRLSADLSKKAASGDTARATITELAHGPSVLTVYAGSPTAKTGLALAGLLDHLARLSETAPGDAEVEVAARALGDGLAVKLDTVGAVADALVRLRVLALPDDHGDTLRKEVAQITPALALKAAGDHLHGGPEIVVVAGDAAVIGPMLSHFAEVKVVDPTRDFARVRSIPRDPDALLDPASPQAR
jgi:predicted Zn-dependent peptidase